MRTVTGLLTLSLFFVPPSALSFGQAEATAMEVQLGSLPDAVGGWKLAGPPRVIDHANIFDYMNGGGELYLAFHFDHMLAYEYIDGGKNDILVELYRMRDAADAFGLLSLDWGGEAVDLTAGTAAGPTSAAVPPARALYGSGLLRIWSDNLYARVMAVRETPESRQAIIELGRAIVAGRRQPSPPKLLELLPPAFSTHWTLKKERTGYFRSHLVLNSLYYLSHENILGLDRGCEAAFTTYEGQGKRFYLLIIRYPEDGYAAAFVEAFLKSYLPEKAGDAAASARSEKGFFQVEDGWLGFKAKGRCLALVFACPDQQSAREIISQVRLDAM